MAEFNDPTKSFLISSAWGAYLTNSSIVIDLVELLAPETWHLQDLNDEQLELLEEQLGMQVFDPRVTSATTPDKIRNDRISLIRQQIEEQSFDKILGISDLFNFEETYEGKPIEDLNRLLINIPVLQDTVLKEKRLVLASDPDVNTPVTYLDTHEAFITFGSIILHARTYQSQGQLYLNTLHLYCNWKPLNELGELLIDRIFAHSDCTKNSDGIYSINANVTKGGILKLVLLLKTGTSIDPWQYQPRWNLLSSEELHSAFMDPDTESALVKAKLDKLPDEVKRRTIT